MALVQRLQQLWNEADQIALGLQQPGDNVDEHDGRHTDLDQQRRDERGAQDNWQVQTERRLEPNAQEEAHDQPPP